MTLSQGQEDEKVMKQNVLDLINKLSQLSCQDNINPCLHIN